MVRTRADNTARRAVAAKAPRKVLASSSPSSTNNGNSKDKFCGGNPVRWTPTPLWQKGIGSFFGKTDVAKNGSPSHKHILTSNSDDVLDKESPSNNASEEGKSMDNTSAEEQPTTSTTNHVHNLTETGNTGKGSSKSPVVEQLTTTTDKANTNSNSSNHDEITVLES